MNIKITNLDTNVNNEDLRKLFSAYGDVQSAEIAIDAFTDLSRGFGFVEMNDEAAKSAIAGLDKSEMNGQIIHVEETQPKTVHKGSYKVGDGAMKLYKFRKN
jgi:RNA recognition motif-containing protein